MASDTAISRNRAVARAMAYFDDREGGYFKDLADCVAVPTESQHAAGLPHLTAYLEGPIPKLFDGMGFELQVFDNPLADAGPVLLASRIEDPALATTLCYGHGDVVMGMEGAWGQGRDPWALSFEGNKVYGRGTADNKGQHLAHIAALRSVIETRGRLGFNAKVCIEMGEENGSRGLREVIAANREAFKCDAFFASDGPRTDVTQPQVTLGNRGGCHFDLVCDLREGGHHSGNWGGALANPAIILAHAISTITDAKGRIQVDGWRPPLPDWVRDALADIARNGGANAPAVDEDWGEPGLTTEQKVCGWNSFEVLAMITGDPEKPVNAIPPKAVARCQIRFVVGTDAARIIPNLRRHLDERGFRQVEILAASGTDGVKFKASRSDPDHPFVSWLTGALDRLVDGRYNLLPNSGGSNVTAIIGEELGVPHVWLPLSYTGCSQHAPDEHILVDLTREGVALLSALYFDMGDEVHGWKMP